MTDNKRFGKKPVRGSKPDNQSEARVYKPRTAQRPSKEDFEEKKQKPFREDRYEEKRSYEQRSDSKKRTRGDDRPRKTDAPTYKPRTWGSREDQPEREKSTPRYTKPSRPEKRTEKETSSNYYEEKFGRKPTVKPEEKVVKFTEKKTFEKRPERKPATEFDAKLKTDKDGLIRLNKYIANSGICSRREADEYIAKGHITVNDIVVTELGSKVKLTDKVSYKGKRLDPEKKVYILLNKPKDYVTTVDDPHATNTVMELIAGACEQRVYPVGRLDRNSSGLLLFTNDGEMTKRLTHPSFMNRKIYEVRLDRNVSLADMNAIRAGVDIDGEIVAADAIEYVDVNDKSTIGIEIHSGQNRIVRRIFEKFGYRVYKLDRVYFAGLTKKNLPRGKWRFLTEKEVNMLKMNRF